MKECLICKKEFSKPTRYSYKQWEAAKYCSYKCFAVVTPLRKNKGKKPWNYRGISSEDKLERARFRKEVQKQIFERDNYTCQLCGSKKDLQVDHIQSWAEYIELRFNMNNCRTLCAKCHYQITFGKPMPENISGWGHNLFKGGNLQ